MRSDKRAPTQQRALTGSLGLLSRADGSAKFTFGESGCLCSVNGPMAVHQKDELLDQATIQVLFSPCSGINGPRYRSMEKKLRELAQSCVLTSLHPRTLIQMTIQVLHEDGSIFAAAVNAMMLALMDAGIPMKTYAFAVSLAVVNDELILDPTSEEEKV